MLSICVNHIYCAALTNALCYLLKKNHSNWSDSGSLDPQSFKVISIRIISINIPTTNVRLTGL